jgi:hypothetical protein
MPTVIEEVTAQVLEPPAPRPDETPARGRQAPDMVRIQTELRRETERVQRLWCD